MLRVVASATAIALSRTSRKRFVAKRDACLSTYFMLVPCMWTIISCLIWRKCCRVAVSNHVMPMQCKHTSRSLFVGRCKTIKFCFRELHDGSVTCSARSPTHGSVTCSAPSRTLSAILRHEYEFQLVYCTLEKAQRLAHAVPAPRLSASFK